MKRILLPYGKLRVLSCKVGISTNTCSKYLRGLVDEETEVTVAKAKQVRQVAMEMGGVMQP